MYNNIARMKFNLRMINNDEVIYNQFQLILFAEYLLDE